MDYSDWLWFVAYWFLLVLFNCILTSITSYISNKSPGKPVKALLQQDNQFEFLNLDRITKIENTDFCYHSISSASFVDIIRAIIRNVTLNVTNLAHMHRFCRWTSWRSRATFKFYQLEYSLTRFSGFRGRLGPSGRSSNPFISLGLAWIYNRPGGPGSVG